MSDLSTIINDLLQKHQPCEEGHPATYIPALAKADVNDFAIAVVTVSGEVYTAGLCHKEFSLQSASKPFVYGMVLEDSGRSVVLSKVGVEPSGEAFNSIVELEKKTHRPYNPMINSGAIAISSLLDGKTFDDRLIKMIDRMSLFAGRNLAIDEEIFLSEKSTAHRNRSIAHLLRHFEIIDDKIEETLDLYFKQCSFMVNTIDLAMMGATLANKGINPKSHKKALDQEYVGDVLSLMFSCGMYDTSGEWAYSVGIPAKSGVSGGIVGVVPGKMGIAVYSPYIDKQGHSIRGKKVFAGLSKALALNVFRL